MKPTPYLLLAALLAALLAQAQWPTSPDQRLYVASAASQLLVSDGDGGAFILLNGLSMYGLQKLDREGYPVFPSPLNLDIGWGEQTTIYRFIPDGQGGAIAAVRYERQIYDSTRVGLFRFDHDGNVIYWNVAPVQPVFWNNYGDYNIAPDGSGGVYVVMGVAVDNARVQHLGPSGERLWGDEGIFLDIGAAPNNEHCFALSADEEGCYGCAIGAEYLRYAFKFSSDGDPLWGLPGMLLPGYGSWMEVAPDGYGGMVGAYRGYDGLFHLYAYRLNSAGQWVWTPGGVDLGEMYFQLDLVSKPPFTYVCWDSAREENTQSKLCKLDSNGVPVWPENITILSGFEGKMVDADNTGLLFMGLNDTGLYCADKYSYMGERLWENDMVLNTPIFEAAGYHTFAGDGSGGGLYAWSELDASWWFRTCAAMVNRDGQMGVVLAIAENPQLNAPQKDEPSVHPNPANSQSILTLPASVPPNVTMELRLMDILGRTIYRQNAKTERRTLAIFEASNPILPLTSGVYLLQIRCGGNTWSKKIVYLR